jgi:hypothetical protein
MLHIDVTEGLNTAANQGIFDTKTIDDVQTLNYTWPGTLRARQLKWAVNQALPAITAAAGSHNNIDHYDGAAGGSHAATTGWTGFCSSLDTSIVYVSNSNGSAGYDGFFPNFVSGTTHGPKKTIAGGMALIRPGRPDWLLLSAGDTWRDGSGFGTLNRGGRSAAELMVIGAYGAGNGRPLVYTGSGNGITGSNSVPGTQNIGINGIAFISDGNVGIVDGDSNTGIEFFGQTANLLVEDCLVSGYTNNISIQRTPNVNNPAVPDSSWNTNVVIRRNIIVESHHRGQTFQGHGMYVYGVNGLLIEENIFDGNGWRRDLRDSYPNFNRHNLYCQNINAGVVFRGNVCTLTDSQFRAGGQVRNNLFLETYTAIQWGLGTSLEGQPNGIAGSIVGNVQIDSGDIGTMWICNAGTWNAATSTLSINTPPNIFAGIVTNGVAPVDENGNLVGITFHLSAGSGVVVGDYTILSSTTSTLVIAGSNIATDGANNIKGYVNFGATQGLRGNFIYGGNVIQSDINYNLIAHNKRGHNAKAFYLSNDNDNGSSQAELLSFANTTFNGNIVYNWGSNPSAIPAFGGMNVLFERNDPNAVKYGNIKFINNIFHNTSGSEELIWHSFNNTLRSITSSVGNNFFLSAGSNAWIYSQGDESLAAWKASLTPPDTTSTSTLVSFTNSSVNAVSYFSSISGGNGINPDLNLSSYVSALRLQRRGSYTPTLMPTYGGRQTGPFTYTPGTSRGGPLRYLRLGFDMSALGVVFNTFSPSSGSRNGTTPFVITGSGFTLGAFSGISFSTSSGTYQDASSVDFWSDTVISGTTPINDPILCNVKVDNGEGVVTKVGCYTFT